MLEPREQRGRLALLGRSGMGDEMVGETQQQLCILGRLIYVRLSLMVCSLILGGI